MSKSYKKSSVLITLAVLFALAFSGRIMALSADGDEPADDQNPQTIENSQQDNGTGLTAQNSDQSAVRDLEKLCLTGEAATLIQVTQTSLEEKEMRLGQREAELEVLEKKLLAENEKLQNLEASLEQRWNTMQASANDDLTHLARMYEAMKPDKAAAIFNKMDHQFAAGFLRLMKSEQAALIMANMTADSAYLVSVTIANQNNDIRAAQLN
jgi:flagellar motility protein MotE (MotC chaperone)